MLVARFQVSIDDKMHIGGVCFCKRIGVWTCLVFHVIDRKFVHPPHCFVYIKQKILPPYPLIRVSPFIKHLRVEYLLLLTYLYKNSQKSAHAINNIKSIPTTSARQYST